MTPRLSLGISTTLWLTVIGLSAALSVRYDHQWDWTAGNRNTLTEASKALLLQLPSPVDATAYVFPSAAVQRDIRARFVPYLREKANFSLNFVDPTTDPTAVRELGIQSSGQVVIRYQGREETLSVLSEPEITAALQRLSHADAALVVFLSGHGERDPTRSDQSGLSDLAELLRSKGMVIQRLALATTQIPPAARLVVLAAPQTELLPGEIQRLRDYLAAGGNLLWMHDPHLAPTPELAPALGVRWRNGTLIYQDYELLGSGHPALALVADYSDHPITARLDSVTAFPLAGALDLDAAGDWDQRVLLRSVKRSWLESGPVEGNLVFDQGSDTLGPLPLAMAAERQRGEQQQRAVVIADSDFLSNAYLGQLGNRAFTVAVFQWLLSRDAQIHVDLPPAPDTTLQLSPLATRILALLFVLVLPVTLTVAGLWRWRRRSRRQ